MAYRNHLPETSQAWIALILRQPPPLSSRFSATAGIYINTSSKKAKKPMNLTSVFSTPANRWDKSFEKGFQPKNTEVSSNWAVKVFNEWLLNRNSQCPVSFQCPRDLLVKPYPPAVVDQWLWRHIKLMDLIIPQCPSMHYWQVYSGNFGRILVELLWILLTGRTTCFQKKKNALDQQLQLLRSKGIGVMKKQASSDYSWAGGTALGNGCSGYTFSRGIVECNCFLQWEEFFA